MPVFVIMLNNRYFKANLTLLKAMDTQLNALDDYIFVKIIHYKVDMRSFVQQDLILLHRVYGVEIKS